MSSIGQSVYRRGALQRLEEAGILLRAELFGGSIYLAGRAVEGMLRAMAWRADPGYRTGRKTLETGHDLRDLLRLVKGLGVLRHADVRLENSVQEIAYVWFNNMRFLDTHEIERHWRKVGAIGRHVTIKKAAVGYYDICVDIVNRCEAICKR